MSCSNTLTVLTNGLNGSTGPFGNDMKMYSGSINSDIPVTNAIVTIGTFIPVITPNLLNSPFNVYAPFSCYNKGFDSRCNLTGTSKYVVCNLPLSHMFGFCRGYQKISRGLRFRAVLNREADVNAIYQDVSAGALAQSNLTYISMWIPKLAPSLETLKILDDNLRSDKITTCNFQEMSLWRSPTASTGPANNSSYQVSTSMHKPIRLWCIFQNALRVNDPTGTYNKRVFDNFLTTSIQVRLNNQIFPQFQLLSDVATFPANNATYPNYTGPFPNYYSKFSRSYFDFLRSGNKTMTTEDSSFVNENTWASLYPIYSFDFTHQDESLYRDSQLAELQVFWTNTAPAATSYFLYVIIESERRLQFMGKSGSLALVT